MIEASLYQVIYILVITIITLIVVKNRHKINTKENFLGSFFLCSFLILYIGFRPHSKIFADTIVYSSSWNMIEWKGFDWNVENKLFDNLYTYMGSFTSCTMFFIVIAAIYFYGMLLACRKLFPSNTLIVFLACLAAFSTFSYGTNGIKAGAAASLFLIALAYKKNIIISLSFLLLSWGFHHSMILPVAAYIITCIFKKKEWYFYGWLVCLIMAIFHISFFQHMFSQFTDERGTDYLLSSGNDWGGKSGFRLDFVIYSSMPVLIGYLAKFKYNFKDKLYDNMLYTYLTCNAVWMLCMYANFTNRIAYLSWFMYPILLVYPSYAIANINHPLVRYRYKIVLGHLAFTLFMMFVYY